MRSIITRHVYAAVCRVLGGGARDLNEEEIAKLSPAAQRQLLDVLRRLENKRPSTRDVMREMARGRIPPFSK